MSLLDVLIPSGFQTIGAYLLYDWAKKTNHEANRKNPADYANDQ